MSVRKPLLIAHRGGAGLWPENTMAAFTRAFEMGADGAELDAQLTKDGEVIVFHDFALKPEIVRDAGGAWLSKEGPSIAMLNAADLRAFDVGRIRPGTAYHQRFARQEPCDGERIPLLRDVVRLARKMGKRLWIELKTPPGGVGPQDPAVLARAVIDLLDEERARDLALFVAFDWTGLIAVKKIAPEIGVYCLTRPQEISREVFAQIKAVGAEAWFGFVDDVNAASAAEARGFGLGVAAWPVNAQADLRRVLALACDAVCTDRPDLMLEILRE